MMYNIASGTGLSKRDSPGLKARDQIIREIWACGNEGKAGWKKKNGYHTRSLVETEMYRFKSTFGGKLKSRNFENQETEVLLRAYALNKMTMLGMPDSYPIK